MEKQRVATTTTATTLFCIVSVVLVHGLPTTSSPVSVPAMFVFGDSLIDCGNNNYIPTLARANYYPFGIDFGFPTGRFCNGLTMADYYARYLGLPLIPPYMCPTSKGKNILRGLNYASAAAGILDETGHHYGARAPFSEQISQFETTIRLKLPALFKNQEELTQYISKSIFVVNIGSNDYINNYLLPSRYNTSRVYNGDAFAKLLVNTLSRQLSRLYNLGARKIVVVGLAPLGCIPSQLSKAITNNINNNNCVKEVNNLVTMFNSHLIHLANTLNATLPGSFFVYQQTYNLTYKMVTNPFKYGFVVSNKACCGNGRYGGYVTCLPLQHPCKNRNKYVFWDSFHPTQAANAIVAKSCFSNSSNACYPINIYELAQL